MLLKCHGVVVRTWYSDEVNRGYFRLSSNCGIRNRVAFAGASAHTPNATRLRSHRHTLSEISASICVMGNGYLLRRMDASAAREGSEKHINLYGIL